MRKHNWTNVNMLRANMQNAMFKNKRHFSCTRREEKYRSTKPIRMKLKWNEMKCNATKQNRTKPTVQPQPHRTQPNEIERVKNYSANSIGEFIAYFFRNEKKKVSGPGKKK